MHEEHQPQEQGQEKGQAEGAHEQGAHEQGAHEHGVERGDGATRVEERIPLVGVMCIDLAKSLATPSDKWHSYLAASYIKHLEASGGLVVPIWIGRDREYYASIMDKVNGLLLPGGAVFLDDEQVEAQPELTNYCVRSMQYIFELAVERNAVGKYFPLWGTCLGFQLMLINAAGNSQVRTECGRMFDVQPLRLTDDYRESKMLGQLTPAQAEEMQRIPFACHQHRYCITAKSLQDFKILKDWHVLATRDSPAGEPFITLIEHRRWPFYGCQFHPERDAYEQLFMRPDSCSESHTPSAMRLAQFFAEFFVAACRRNTNHFANVKQLSQHLINNWMPVYSGKHKESHWMQVYLFRKDANYCLAD